MPKWYEIKAAVDDTAEIMIYEEIGVWGVEAKQFIDDLSEVTASKIDLRLNTPGGSVFDGNAIYNALKRHPASITTYIDGLAASMGSIIALAGERVVMADNAMYMIHNPRTVAWGDANEFRKTAGTLDKLKSSMVRIYSEKTGLSEDEVTGLMDSETWYTASEAKESGFADEIEEGLKAAASFKPDKFKSYKNTPQTLLEEKPEPEPEPDYSKQVVSLQKARMKLSILEREPA